ncbi:hypothetical protein CERZMDRAFT_83894 [Cercospora zeae-maydis SCOH1-5]|uniref:F-box domain-containing protein n=1 Tax=Cercospora zeae-maydis SCOH1-5 TaxID=717836 RepID=A0A6A6FHU8_9PEZI|nr:hypothetical protein CERZMDRAFT_83894 [Cercospora zeae-maydis SCOH1-5]
MAHSPPIPSSDVSLADLPQELLVRVATFLTTDELAPLRCSCKHIERQLFDSFAHEFFTKRQFLLEHESLEALVAISKHPGLASKLTEVIIDVRAFGPNRWLDEKRIRKGHVSRQVLLHTGLARDMLVEVFSNLPNLRTLGLRDYNGAGRIRDGEDARWRPWGWSISHASLVHCQPPEPVFAMLLFAVAKARARPSHVEVFLRRRALQHDTFQCCLGTLGSDIIPVLNGLKTLRLAVSSEGSSASRLQGGPGSPYMKTNAVETPFRRFLHHTSNLESLRLNFVVDEFLGSRTIEWLIDSPTPNSQLSNGPIPPLQLQSLRCLDFGMANTSARALAQVLERTNLESFSLWKMTLQARSRDHISDCGWSFLLSRLSTSLPSSTRLRKIMIGYGAQALYLGEIRDHRWDTTISFVPEGTGPTDRVKAAKEHVITFEARYTGKSVQQWLQEMSERTFVTPDRDTASPAQSDPEDVSEDEDDSMDEDDSIVEDSEEFPGEAEE